MSLSEPGVTWMYPEPVPTLRVGVPLTCKVLSNVPSAASISAGEIASVAIANHRVFILPPDFLILGCSILSRTLRKGGKPSLFANQRIVRIFAQVLTAAIQPSHPLSIRPESRYCCRSKFLPSPGSSAGRPSASHRAQRQMHSYPRRTPPPVPVLRARLCLP